MHLTSSSLSPVNPNAGGEILLSPPSGSTWNASIILARILEGTEQPGSLAQSLGASAGPGAIHRARPLQAAFGSLPTTQQDQIRIRWGSHFNEILSLSRETNAELFHEALFHLGQRLEREGRVEQAGLVYGAILTPHPNPLPQGERAIPPHIQQQAQERITILGGGGSIGQQMEHMGRGFAQSALDPGLLLGATGMGLFGKGVELVGMRWLSGANFFRRSYGLARTALEFAPRAGGFALEATAFPFAINGANELLGRPVSWAHMDHRIYGSWFFLGGMRAGGGIGSFAQRSLGVPGLQIAGSIAGVGLGHGGEVLAGLKEWHGFSNFAVETFGTWANIRVAGRFSEYVFDGQISRMQRIMDLSIEGRRDSVGVSGYRGVGEKIRSWVISVSEGFDNMGNPPMALAAAGAAPEVSPRSSLFAPRSRPSGDGTSQAERLYSKMSPIGEGSNLVNDPIDPARVRETASELLDRVGLAGNKRKGRTSEQQKILDDFQQRGMQIPGKGEFLWDQRLVLTNLYRSRHFVDPKNGVIPITQNAQLHIGNKVGPYDGNQRVNLIENKAIDPNHVLIFEKGDALWIQNIGAKGKMRVWIRSPQSAPGKDWQDLASGKSQQLQDGDWVLLGLEPKLQVVMTFDPEKQSVFRVEYAKLQKGNKLLDASKKVVGIQSPWNLIRFSQAKLGEPENISDPKDYLAATAGYSKAMIKTMFQDLFDAFEKDGWSPRLQKEYIKILFEAGPDYCEIVFRELPHFFTATAAHGWSPPLRARFLLNLAEKSRVGTGIRFANLEGILGALETVGIGNPEAQAAFLSNFPEFQLNSRQQSQPLIRLIKSMKEEGSHGTLADKIETLAAHLKTSQLPLEWALQLNEKFSAVPGNPLLIFLRDYLPELQKADFSTNTIELVLPVLERLSEKAGGDFSTLLERHQGVILGALRAIPSFVVKDLGKGNLEDSLRLGLDSYLSEYPLPLIFPTH